MKSPLRYGIPFLISILLGACETVSDEMRVLEKSRQSEPTWLSNGPGFKPSAEGIDFVLLKDKVLDLTLGLKQAEASVLYNLKFQMYQLILSNVDQAQLGKITPPVFQQQISKILDKELTKDNLKDFYFDKVSVPTGDNGLIPEYYRIYVYARVDAKQRATITSSVKSYILSSTSQNKAPQSKSLSQF
ncbi:MAG: hypothetical protein EOP07_02290 [Proteobacteria bacterium]|nr:MAG: hypothetical protein EOP07_02290 [Pseudomonadota bacterium]